MAVELRKYCEYVGRHYGTAAADGPIFGVWNGWVVDLSLLGGLAVGAPADPDDDVKPDHIVEEK